MFNRVNCSVDELEIWGQIVSITVFINDWFDGRLEDYGGGCEGGEACSYQGEENLRLLSQDGINGYRIFF